MIRLKTVGKGFFSFPFLIAFIYSCAEQTCQNEVQLEIPSFNVLVDSLMLTDKILVGCSDDFPAGVSDSVIFGYTNMDEGIYQNCKSEYSTLSIVGLKFEDLTSQYENDFEYYYHFNFTDLKEKETFENFQQFSANYIRHGKNTTHYFQIKDDWFQYYKPMP